MLALRALQIRIATFPRRSQNKALGEVAFVRDERVVSVRALVSTPPSYFAHGASFLYEPIGPLCVFGKFVKEKAATCITNW